MLPTLTKEDINNYFELANNSERKRFPKILHKKGSDLNEVLNFMIEDTYMQPHLHPENKMEEKIHIMIGKLAVIFFDDQGKIKNKFILEKGKLEFLKVPSRTWHTYIMLTKKTCSYEQMYGVYDPLTWKKMADWAPKENTNESILYLNKLRKIVID